MSASATMIFGSPLGEVPFRIRKWTDDIITMNPIAFHVASGDAFFSGALIVAISCWMHAVTKTWMRRIATLGIVVGLVLIAISSPGIPNSLLLMLVVLTLIAMMLNRYYKKSRSWLLLSVTLSLSIVVIQTTYLFPKSLTRINSKRLVVIGDSIAAGMNEPESEKWPSLLAQNHSLFVDNLSVPGATTATINTQIDKVTDQPCVVILEIGGNDILGGRSIRDFSIDLRTLVKRLSKPGRVLLMFELPLPPFHDRFSRVQKELAREFDISLLPKRDFLSVLVGKDATSDSLHLTSVGHKSMAATVWRYINGAYCN